jgi:hypothetical protein
VTTEQEFDDVLAEAIRQTGLALTAQADQIGADAIQERDHMQPAIAEVLRRLLGEAAVQRERRLRFDHWQGDPPRFLGGVDIAVADSKGSWHALMELKWCPFGTPYLGWAIWDFYKMATGRFSPGADCCYLVAGAPDAVWAEPGTAGELFRNEDWLVADVYGRYEKIWIGDGNDCKKLTGLPIRVETILVVDQALLPSLDSWRIKAIRIEPDTTEWLTLEQGRLVPG